MGVHALHAPPGTSVFSIDCAQGHARATKSRTQRVKTDLLQSLSTKDEYEISSRKNTNWSEQILRI